MAESAGSARIMINGEHYSIIITWCKALALGYIELYSISYNISSSVSFLASEKTDGGESSSDIIVVYTSGSAAHRNREV